MSQRLRERAYAKINTHFVVSQTGQNPKTLLSFKDKILCM